MTTPSTTRPWAFRARFRREAYGWKGSRLAISRLKEALAEIRAVARQDPALAAEGAVLLLEKLSPALCRIDSSSGALGQATYAAVETLVPLIAQASVSEAVRRQWLERLFEAHGEDDPPYIENLGGHWGTLCASPALASAWADQLLPTLQLVLHEQQAGRYAFDKHKDACLSALFAAGRHDEILQLLAMDPRPYASDRLWAARVLAARGQIDEAIACAYEGSEGYAQQSLARFAQTLLLQAGRRAEAFDRFALAAHQGNTRLATFRALARTYPELPADRLLDHLVACSPGQAGQWFATAKTLKLHDRAVTLAWASPCDPATLNRAARDHLTDKPDFALQCALASLHWIAEGYGYELSTLDVLEAWRMGRSAAQASGQTGLFENRLSQILASERPRASWMQQALRAAGQR